MRQSVVGALKKFDACSVENRCGPGTPDVNYVEGWIECKWAQRWPVGTNTVLKLVHPLETAQKVWLQRRWRRGGNAFVLLQVRKDWLLFDPPTAARIFDKATRSQLIREAIKHWDHFPGPDLANHLTRWTPTTKPPSSS